jgi:hypothetical protein
MFAGEAVIESIDNRRRSASLRFVHQFSLTPDPLKTQIFCCAKLSAVKAKPSSERLEIVPSSEIAAGKSAQRAAGPRRQCAHDL